MGPGHQHGAAVSAGGAQRGRLLTVLAITAVVLAAEVAGGVITGSLALLADAGHMFTDVAGLGLAVLAVTFAAKSPNVVVITEARPQPFTWPFRAPKRPYPLTCAYAPLRYSGAIVGCTSDVPPRASCYRVRIRHTLHA